MKLVKISNKFFNDCKKNNIHKELMFNEDGRPSVLIVRSNISPTTPKNQYMSLPPNSKTKPHHSHGIHYIKIFPITDKYVQSYLISDPFDLMVKNIIDNNESEIIQACQDYLFECENGNKHFMTPDIDGIIKMLDMLDENKDTN